MLGERQEQVSGKKPSPASLNPPEHWAKSFSETGIPSALTLFP